MSTPELSPFFSAIAELVTIMPRVSDRTDELRYRCATAVANVMGWTIPARKRWSQPPYLSELVGKRNSYPPWPGHLYSCATDHGERFYVGRTVITVGHSYNWSSFPDDLHESLIHHGLAATELALPSWYYPFGTTPILVARAEIVVPRHLAQLRIGVPEPSRAA